VPFVAVVAAALLLVDVLAVLVLVVVVGVTAYEKYTHSMANTRRR